MGLMERSKSLRRKQSTTEVSRVYSEDGIRKRSNTNVAQAPVHNPTRQYHEGDSGPGISPMAAKISRNNPLPTPDKDPFYHPNSSTQTIEISADSQTYRFPTPSPRSAPRGSPFQPPRDPATIGVALGSPRLQVPQPHLRESPSYHSPLRTYSEPVVPKVDPEPHKLRKSRSKSFRNVFSKAPPPPAKPIESQPLPNTQWQQERPARSVATVQAGQSQIRVSDSASPAYILSSASEQASRNVTRQQRRAEIDRIHMEKRREVARHTKTGSGPKPTPAPIQIKPATFQAKKPNYKEIKIPEFQSNVLSRVASSSGSTSQESIVQGSFLDVDIPKSDMERYSVMFEKLLKPSPPSLAERRGASGRLRPLAEEGPVPTLAPLAPPRRRATSPAVPSPDIVQKSIRQATQSHKEAADRLMQIRRSKTAPVGSIQPPPVPRKSSISNLAKEIRAPSPASPLWSEASLPLTPDSTTHTFFSHDDGENNDEGLFTALRDSTSSNHSVHPQRMDSLTDMEEPSPKRKPSVSLPYQPSADERTPRAIGAHDTYAHDAEIRMGHVKVARSISVTRPRPGKHVPVAVKQPVRPRVVDLHPVGGTRKSTMVLIEQA
ncbi:hypothetical protein K461DRAFT_298349 [Myriangium duriaei CBS 260.36]|uniref:Uncharacterized protein n=1 Tax=Myriangium duriaei CBS 260.36 TaxID=1168546 RepID=A0A9P4MFA8_9PEZI|nr:hypothetical protein K461DRAFT_298349 [Myriangium duriaei CBS 260.36]